MWTCGDTYSNVHLKIETHVGSVARHSDIPHSCGSCVTQIYSCIYVCMHMHLRVHMHTPATIYTAIYTWLLRRKDTPINTPIYTGTPHLHMYLYTHQCTWLLGPKSTHRTHMHTWICPQLCRVRALPKWSIQRCLHGPSVPHREAHASRHTSKDTRPRESRTAPSRVHTHRHSLKHSDPI